MRKRVPRTPPKPTTPPTAMGNAVCRLSSILSGLVFLWSLPLDGFSIVRDAPGAYSPGWGLLIIGWLAVPSGVFAWLGNPLLTASWVMMWTSEERKTATMSSAAAIVLALSFLAYNKVPTDANFGWNKVTSVGPSYWFWVVAIAIAFLGCIAAVGIDLRSASILGKTESEEYVER